MSLVLFAVGRALFSFSRPEMIPKHSHQSASLVGMAGRTLRGPKAEIELLGLGRTAQRLEPLPGLSGRVGPR